MNRNILSLGRALDCARRVAELSVALLNGSDFHQDEIRCLRRDLPHFIRQVSADCRGDEPLAADLRHELTCLEEDARELIDWVTHAYEAQRVLYSAIGTDPDAPLRYGLAHHKAFEEFGPKRQGLLESCHRVYLVAMRVCTATDKAAITPPIVVAQNPVADIGSQLPGIEAIPPTASGKDDPRRGGRGKPPTNKNPNGPEAEDDQAGPAKGTREEAEGDDADTLDGLSVQSQRLLKKLRDLIAFDPSSRQRGEVIAENLRQKAATISRQAQPIVDPGNWTTR